MKAMVYSKYGSPEVLKLEERDIPQVKEKEVLIKVYATSLNASDYEMLTAQPIYTRMWGLFKPKYQILGSDVAGEVVAVGQQVTRFKPGDKVYGDLMEVWGGLAEYVCAPEKALLHQPPEKSFEEMAALPQAAVVALQGLRDKGQIKTGDTVLIVGAGGGAGSFAIQLAKMFGAEVTGVDNASKQDFMQSLGADFVIDYQKENYTENNKQYDLILDLVAPHSIGSNKRVLKKQGRYVLVGGSVSRLFSALVWGGIISKTTSKKMGVLAAHPNHKDLKTIVDLIKTKKIKPIIDKIFPLQEAPAAFHYLGSGKAKGKVLIQLTTDSKIKS